MTREAAIAGRALAGAGALFFLLLTLAAVSHPVAAWPLRVLMGGLLAGTAFRPSIGLMVAAAFLPLFPAIEGGLDLDDVAESRLLLLSPVLGAALARLAAMRVVPRGHLPYPAIAFAAVIAADAATRLRMVAPAGVFTSQFADRAWTHLTSTYFTDPGSFAPLHPHVAWLAAIALAVVVELVMVAEPRARAPLVRLAITGAAGLALFSINRVVEVALRSTNPLAAAVDVITSIRFTPFHRDINAAGSFYVLLAVPPLWRVLTTRSWGYALAALPLGAALWFSGSRAALLAAPAGLLAAWVFTRQLRRRTAAVGLVAIVVATVALAFASTRIGQIGARGAVDIRLDLMGVALRVAATRPAFGVGLERFDDVSARFISPELAERFPEARAGENAHNNFLQVLGELGVVGLATFLWLLLTPFALAARARPDRPPNGPALAGGLAAFAVTCLAGHPLLTPHVRWCFFLVVGLSAGLLGSGQSTEPRLRLEQRIAAAIALVVLLSLPFRL
jgi:hypothetical protein